MTTEVMKVERQQQQRRRVSWAKVVLGTMFALGWASGVTALASYSPLSVMWTLGVAAITGNVVGFVTAVGDEYL